MIISDSFLNFAVGYPLGVLLIFLGLVALFPKLFIKIFKKEPNKTTVPVKIATALVGVLGIVVIVARAIGVW